MDAYCRTCYRTNVERKFDVGALSQVTDVQIGEMITYCLQIEVSPYDMLPQNICETCLCSLNSMYLFRKHCYHSDTELRKMLKYAPPEHFAVALNIGHDPNLVDPLLAHQNEHDETMDIKSDETDIPTTEDNPMPNLSAIETLLPEDFTEEITNKPVVVEKYVSKVFECEQCDYRTSFKGNLMRHLQKRNHTGFRVSVPSDRALRQTTKTLLCCGECSFQTFVRGNFAQHQRIWKHTTSSTRDVEVARVLEKFPTCPHCGVQRANLEKHMAKWCQVLSGTRTRRKPKEERSKEDQATKPRKKRARSIKKARLIEPKMEIDNGQVIVPDSLTDELTDKPVVVEKYLSKVFECEQCDYRSSFKGNLMRHHQSRNHTGIRVSIPSDLAPRKTIKTFLCCGECNFQTVFRTKLSQHQRIWKHTTSSTRDVEVARVLEQFPTCPHCGVQRADLETHMAKWCQVLCGTRTRRRGHESKSDAKAPPISAVSIGEEPPIELKIEIDNSDEINS